jgi:hypothetical protein
MASWKELTQLRNEGLSRHGLAGAGGTILGTWRTYPGRTGHGRASRSSFSLRRSRLGRQLRLSSCTYTWPYPPPPRSRSRSRSQQHGLGSFSLCCEAT